MYFTAKRVFFLPVILLGWGAWTAPAMAEEVFRTLGLDQVEIGGEIGRRIDVTVDNNLMKLDLEKDFLKSFREKKANGGFIGLGMLLDAAVRLAAYRDDPQVLERKEHLVEEILKLQEADGYLGMCRPEARLGKLWDIHEMAYLVHGLLSDYQCFGNRRSLDAAVKLADYIVSGWTAKPDIVPGGGRITVLMAVTGLEPALLRMYKETGNQRYLDFCVAFRKLPEWEGPIVLGRWGTIEGHAYAHCARCIAQIWLNDIQPKPTLLDASHKVMEFLACGNGMALTGACGSRECWHDTQSGGTHLGETCATAYLLRTWNELLQREGKCLYGDFMERAIHNALFAAQSPDGRRIRYYVPFEKPREYFPRDSYCCPNNYRRVISVLPEMIYYLADGGLVVNLYTPSTAKVDLGQGKKLQVRQETDYPNTGRVVLHLDPAEPTEFPLSLRIPRWCKNVKISVGGNPVEGEIAGGRFHVIRRQWKPGDRVELALPMALRPVKGRKAQAGRVAVMRGPMVFCLNRAKHEKLNDVDLTEITLDPATLEGPFPDDSVRPGGMACRVKAWAPKQWYPHTPPALELTLTEYADPGGEHTYFLVPNPRAADLVDDELVGLDLEKTP